SCPVDSIVGALGMGIQDLYPPDPVAVMNGIRPALNTPGKRSWKSPEEALRTIASKIEPKPTTMQSWTYHDTHGKPVMVVGRIDAAGGSKTYRPFHVLPDGSWAVGNPPGLLPLYGLPDLTAADLVIVLEGEKCADAARVTGWVTTT